MKKFIVTLCLFLVLLISLVSCGRNNNNNSSNDTKNEGVITDTGTDTNIIDEAESGIKGIRDNIMGAN